MSKVFKIEERVIQRAMETFPQISELVPSSTPVVSFGDPTIARVVTVGINPSSIEFLTKGKNKKILTQGEKRLIDLEELGLKNPDSLDRDSAIKVIKGCYQYFETKPYEWFDQLQNYVLAPTGNSYQDGSACHLDLVQWATDPVWGNIVSSKVKENLLKGDVDFLRYQVNSKDFDFIFINGLQVFNQLNQHKIVEAKVESTIKYLTKAGKRRFINFYAGRSEKGSLILGWSRTFPGHYVWDGALPQVVEQLHEHFKKFLG